MVTNYLAPTATELEREWGLAPDADWPADVTRGDEAPIIRRFGVGAAAQREVVLARFGFLPASAKSEQLARSPLNARAEIVASRSTFKAAYAERHWCIIPALALYVPRYGADGQSQRWRIRRVDRAPLAIAGIWDRWIGPGGRTVVSFAMLTINCDLHPLLSGFDRAVDDHGEPVEKRTPVLLGEEDFDAWLDASPGRAPIYFGTFGKDDLEAEPASTSERRTTRAMGLHGALSTL